MPYEASLPSDSGYVSQHGMPDKEFPRHFQLSFDGYGVIILNAVGTADAYFIPADKSFLSGMILPR